MLGKLIKDKAVRESIASASVVGLNLVSATFVGLLLGWWLDRWLGTKPWLLLTFLILGIAAGFKNMVLEVRKIQKADAEDTKSMGKMMQNLRDGLDRWLYRRGYVHPEVRELVRNQLVLTALVCVVCLPFAGVSVAAWSFAAGTAIITANFCSLAKFGQRITGFGNKREAIAAVLARFYFRLALTGLVLFGLIVWFGATPLPLLAGIATVVVNFIVWGVARHAGSKTHQTLTGKEA